MLVAYHTYISCLPIIGSNPNGIFAHEPWAAYLDNMSGGIST